jgi:hypothetical protein
VLIPFVFLSVVLSAMQVCVSLDTLESNKAFLNASYGVALFSMVFVLVLVSFVAIIPTFVFFRNLVAAIGHAIAEQEKRRILTRQRFESQL